MTVKAITSFPEFLNAIDDGEQTVFIDFWAEWCGPCKAIKPIYESLSSEHGTVAKFYSVDINNHDDIAQEVRITHVPTIMVFKGGNPLDSTVGAEHEALSAFVGKHAPLS